MIRRPQRAAILCALALSSSCQSGDRNAFSPANAFSIAGILAREARGAESSTVARDAEITICLSDSPAYSSRATPGHLAGDYAVLKAVADSLKSWGFQCTLRTTTRRSTRDGLVRVDQALDLVATRKADDASRTVVLAISYDATASGDSIVGGLWPAAVTVAALRALKVAGYRNTIVLAIASTSEWGVFNSALPGDPPASPTRVTHVTEIAGGEQAAAPVVFFESPGWMIGFVPGADHEADVPFPIVHQPPPAIPSDTLRDSISTSPASAIARPTMNILQSVRIDADEDRRALLSASARRFFTALRTAHGRGERSLIGRSLLWLLVIVAPIALFVAARCVVYNRARIRLVEANRAIHRMESWLAVSNRLVRWQDACDARLRRKRGIRPPMPRFTGTVKPYGGWLRRYVSWFACHVRATVVRGVLVRLIRVASMFGLHVRTARGRYLPESIEFMKKRNRLLLQQEAEDDHKKGIAKVSKGWNAMPKTLAASGNGKFVLVGFAVTLVTAVLVGLVVTSVPAVPLRLAATFVIAEYLGLPVAWMTAGLELVWDNLTVVAFVSMVIGATSFFALAPSKARWFALGCSIAVYTGLTTLNAGPLADFELKRLVDASPLTATFALVAIVLGLCQMFDMLDRIDAPRLRSRPKVRKIAEAIVGRSERLTIASYLRSLVFRWDRGRAATLSVAVMVSYVVWVGWFVRPMIVLVWESGTGADAVAISVVLTTAVVLFLPALALLVSAFRPSNASASWILLIPILVAGCEAPNERDVEVAQVRTGLVASVEIDWSGSGDSIVWKAGSDHTGRTAVPWIDAGMDSAFEPPRLEREGIDEDRAEERKTVRLRIRKGGLRGQVLRMRVPDDDARVVSVNWEPVADSVRAHSVEVWFEFWEATGRGDAVLTLELPRCNSVALVVEEIRAGVDGALAARLGPLPSTFDIGDSSSVLVTGRITLRQDWPLPDCCERTLGQRVPAANAEVVLTADPLAAPAHPSADASRVSAAQARKAARTSPGWSHPATSGRSARSRKRRSMVRLVHPARVAIAPQDFRLRR